LFFNKKDNLFELMNYREDLKSNYKK